MPNIGIIGLGSMGMTHFDAYKKIPDAKIVAVADQKFANQNDTVGRAGNIPGQSATTDLGDVKKYISADELLADETVEAVDICTPTMLHKNLALAAIRAGKKFILIEKPMARTAADAQEILNAANDTGAILFPAHCMRFWPGWDWLKKVIVNKTFGEVQSAKFVRIGAKPPVPLYNNGTLIGGAHLDFHIHDTDFILHLFGMPASVTSFGRIGDSGAIEHTLTRYQFIDSNALIFSEGAWSRDAENRPFEMRFEVVFENATAVYSLANSPSLTLFRANVPPESVPLSDALGYANEIVEFVRCVRKRKPSPIVSGIDGVHALKIIEAELKSIETGATVFL